MCRRAVSQVGAALRPAGGGVSRLPLPACRSNRKVEPTLRVAADMCPYPLLPGVDVAPLKRRVLLAFALGEPASSALQRPERDFHLIQTRGKNTPRYLGCEIGQQVRKREVSERVFDKLV